MKFQNPSFKFFLNGQTDKQTYKPKAICSPLFQSWGHNYDGLESPMLHTKFRENRPAGSGAEDF